MTGGAGADTLVGSSADDVLAGLGGKDTLEGGAGADTFLAGADDDAVKARDGRRDFLISCGSGKDSLSADAKDPQARDCEGGSTPPPAPKADLSVTLTDNVDPVVEGDAVEYRFRVDNAGPSAATGVTVATTVPADATVAPASGCSQAGTVVTCAVGDVAVRRLRHRRADGPPRLPGRQDGDERRRLGGRGQQRRQRLGHPDHDGRVRSRPPPAPTSGCPSPRPPRRRRSRTSTTRRR